MSEPHLLSPPNLFSDEFHETLSSVLNYIAESEFADFIQRCLEEGWTIKEARSHVAYQALVLEWYLDPDGYSNPDRYALAEIQVCANEEDWNQLDTSLKLS